MPGSNKRWDDEDEDSSSSAPSSPPPAALVVRRGKFDDEEAEDSDVLDSWDAAEDSEVEREKAKKAAEVKAKAEAEAAANKKSKAQRVAERQAARARELAEADGDSSEDETEADRRERMRRSEQDADLHHAEDLFGALAVSNRKTTVGTAVVVDAQDPNRTVNLADMSLFHPTTKVQFEQLRTTISPLITANAKKAHYTLFLQEFAKQLAKELPSDQIKKISSALTTLSNEKMKEEKAAEKGGKKSKASKNKTTLVGVTRGPVADMNSYDDAFGDDDFM